MVSQLAFISYFYLVLREELKFSAVVELIESCSHHYWYVYLVMRNSKILINRFMFLWELVLPVSGCGFFSSV